MIIEDIKDLAKFATSSLGSNNNSAHLYVISDLFVENNNLNQILEGVCSIERTEYCTSI